MNKLIAAMIAGAFTLSAGAGFAADAPKAAAAWRHSTRGRSDRHAAGGHAEPARGDGVSAVAARRGVAPRRAERGRGEAAERAEHPAFAGGAGEAGSGGLPHADNRHPTKAQQAAAEADVVALIDVADPLSNSGFLRGRTAGAPSAPAPHFARTG